MQYFAYGSNMNLRQMQFRCPHAKLLGWGRIDNWQIVERMYADIEYAEGKRVYGAVFEIAHEQDWHNLDHYEGYPSLYSRLRIDFFWGSTYRKSSAVVYMMTPKGRARGNGIPFDEEYRKICAIGADECLLPVNFYRRGEK